MTATRFSKREVKLYSALAEAREHSKALDWRIRAYILGQSKPSSVSNMEKIFEELQGLRKCLAKVRIPTQVIIMNNL